MSLILFLFWKSLLSPCTTKSIRQQIAAVETTENIAEIPVVQEQVIIQEIPDVVVPLPPVEEFTELVYSPDHQEQMAAGEMTLNINGNSVAQEHAIVQEIPPDVEQIQVEISDVLNTSSTSTSHFDIPSSSSTSTSTDRRLDEFANLLNSCIEQLTPWAA